jgi:DNA polymerase V
MAVTSLLRVRSNISAVFPVAGTLSSKPVPLIDVPRLSAGFPSPAGDYAEGPCDLNELLIRNPSATVFTRVDGDSMEDARIFHGDILVVDRSKPPLPGRIVVAAVDGELFVKRFCEIDGRPALKSENAARPEYRPIFLDQGLECTLWGCVTATVRQF